MKNFQLQIAAPDGMRFDGQAVQISLRGIEGDFAVLAGHIPFVTALKPGVCKVYTEDESGTKITTADYSGGMIIVSKETVRVVCAKFAWNKTEE